MPVRPIPGKPAVSFSARGPLLGMTTLFLTFLLSGALQPLQAQHQAAEGQEEAEHGEAHGHDNTLALFLGAATRAGHEHESAETGGAVGVEYARRLTDRIKGGVLAEWAFTDIERDFVFALPFFAHLMGGLALVAGPGLELVSPLGEATAPDETHHDETEYEFLFRFGTVYEIEVGQWEIGPQVNADIAGGHWTWVYGVSIGKGF